MSLEKGDQNDHPLALLSALLRGLQLTRLITGITIVPGVISVSFRIFS